MPEFDYPGYVPVESKPTPLEKMEPWKLTEFLSFCLIRIMNEDLPNLSA